MSSLVQVASFASAPEAEYTSSYLQSHGVAAFVDGASTGTALSYVGSAIGGIRVLVESVDLDRAQQLVAELSQPSGDGEPWFCGECQEEVDGSFAVCWSRGRERSRVATDQRPLVQEEVRLSEAADSPANSSNPYQPPAEGDVEPPIPETNQQADELMDRAWKAIILGTVVLPFIMQPYGLYLLLQATRVTNDFSPDLNRKFYRVLIAGILSCGLWIGFLRILF